MRFYVAVIVAIVLAASTAGAVSVRFEAELGSLSDAAMRPKAIDAGLHQAVSSIAARHTDQNQRVELSSGYKAVLAKSRSFVTRYVVAEEEVADGVFRARYQVEVEREGLFAALEGAGFKVYRLEDKPRIMVASSGEGLSRRAAMAALELMRGEGVEAAIYDLPAESPEAMAKIAYAKGFHICLLVSMVEPPPVAIPGELEGPPAPLAPGAEPEPVKVELSCAASLLDARTGDQLGKAEQVTLAEADSYEAALEDGVTRGSEELFEAAMGALVKSGWKIGDAKVALEIRVSGLDSPALATEITSLLATIAEFKKVELDSVEYRTASWLVSAVNPGNDWSAVLSGLKTGRGALRWKPSPKSGADNMPLIVEGQWSSR